MREYHEPAGEAWAEVTGADVWNAVKRGASLSFFTGIAAGAAMMFVGGDRFDDGLGLYVATLVVCLVFGTCLYVPLNLGVVAATGRRGFVPGLLRFAHGLVVAVGVTAMVCVIGARVLLMVAKLCL